MNECKRACVRYTSSLGWIIWNGYKSIFYCCFFQCFSNNYIQSLYMTEWLLYILRSAHIHVWTFEISSAGLLWKKKQLEKNRFFSHSCKVTHNVWYRLDQGDKMDPVKKDFWWKSSWPDTDTVETHKRGK